MKAEACLLEITPTHNCSLASHLRSRGYYVLYHVTGRKLYLWVGSKVVPCLRRAANKAAKLLSARYVGNDCAES